MPKTHAKLHNINSPIDHFKMDGLFNLQTGLGMITAAGDDSIKFNAEPILATDPVFQIFDRVPASSAPIFTVDGTGAVFFTRTPALPVTADITGTGTNWYINNDGSALFNGDVTINGYLLGANIIDSLDEILDPAFATPQADRNKAYQKSMFLYDDATPGTLIAFSVDQSAKTVSIGSATVPYDVDIEGSVTIDTSTSGATALAIINSTGNDIENIAGAWSVTHLGFGTFNGLVSNPPLAVGGLVVNTLATSGVSSVTLNHADATSPALIINNTGAVGNDITGTSGLWYTRPNGSSYFTASANIGVAVVGTGIGNAIDIQNAGSGASLNANQIGPTANVVVLSSLGATGADLVIDGSFLVDPGGIWTGADGTNWVWTGGPAFAEEHNPIAPTTLEKSIPIVAGTPYLVSFELKGVTSGLGESITPSLGGTTGTVVSLTGVYSEVIVPVVTAGNISFTPTAGFMGRIDNITVKQLIGGSANAIIDITNTSANYDIEGNAGNWYAMPNGLIHSDDIVQADVAVETPILRNAGALLINSTLPGIITARTIDGDFVFDVASTALAGKVVRPANNADTDFGTVGFAWKNIYTDGIYSHYIRDVWELHGDGTTPHGTLLLASDNQKFNLSSGTENFYIVESGRTLDGNSLTIDRLFHVNNTSGSNLTMHMVSANDIVINAPANHGIIPIADNQVILGGDNNRFSKLWVKEVWGTSQINSQNNAVYQTLLIDCGDPGTATGLQIETGNLGILAYLRNSSSLRPFDNGLNDLGTAVNRWNDLFVEGNVDGVHTLYGSTGGADLVIQSRGVGDIQFNSSSGHIYCTLDKIENTADIIPGTTNAYSLGDIVTPLVWANVYARNLQSDAALTVKAGTNLTLSSVAGNLIENFSGTYSGTFGGTYTISSGAMFLNSSGTISINPGGLADGTVDFNNASLINVKDINGVNFTTSFCQTGGVVTGVKNNEFVIDCDQAVSANVQLTFGTVAAGAGKYIQWNPTGAGGFITNTSLTINGDLFVNGTQTIVDTQHLEVEDNVILCNRLEVGPGITKPSKRGGLEVDRGSITNAGIFFDETVLGGPRWICGIGTEATAMAPGALEEIITTDLTQTLSNKTLISPTIKKNAIGPVIAGFQNALHNHSNADNGGQVSHGSLSNLTNTDDHTQYVHISNARTITAQHTFAPAAIQAPFVLGANAQGVVVTGFNADELDSYHASNNTASIPISNGTVNTDLNADKLDGYHASNNTSSIPISNTTVNTDLNADQLDGYHAASFLLLAGGTMTGNITMTSGTWIGLGAGKGRMVFNDLATDTLTISNANLVLDAGNMIFDTGTYNGILTSTTITVSDKTWTLPDKTGTVAVADALHTLVTNLNADYLDGYDSSDFPRKAENAAITGNWSFASGNIALPQGTVLPIAPGYANGRLFWDNDDFNLFVGTGTAWKQISSYHPFDYQEVNCGRNANFNNSTDLFWSDAGDQVVKPMIQGGVIRGVSARLDAAETYDIVFVINNVEQTAVHVAALQSFYISALNYAYNAGDTLTVRIKNITGTVKHPSLFLMIENTTAA